MKRKGYTPLSADRFGGIGFRRSLKDDNRPLDDKVWFDTGAVMADGKTPRTVCAVDEAQYNEFVKKGWTVAGVKSKRAKKGGKK